MQILICASTFLHTFAHACFELSSFTPLHAICVQMPEWDLNRGERCSVGSEQNYTSTQQVHCRLFNLPRFELFYDYFNIK